MPSWVTALPTKDYDRIIGFCEETGETEAFVLADEAVFLSQSGEWIRVDITKITEMDGVKADNFLDTIIHIRTQDKQTFEYRGKNAFALWSCLKVFVNDASQRIELHLSPELSKALDRISNENGRHRSDLAKEWLSERILVETKNLLG